MKIQVYYLDRVYTSDIDVSITVGEFIRNCCVNLDIDPDTDNGVTSNVYVNFSGYEAEKWNYNPYSSIGDSEIILTSKVYIFDNS